jgi:uncharacterized membrane protein HdeD (DUF308 family)
MIKNLYLKAGAYSGLISGIVFGVIMAVMGMLPIIAKLVGGESALLGFLALPSLWGHLIWGFVLGLSYSILFTRMEK